MIVRQKWKYMNNKTSKGDFKDNQTLQQFFFSQSLMELLKKKLPIY